MTSEQGNLRAKIEENKKRIEINKQLPWLVANIVEILDLPPEEEAEDSGIA